MKIERRPTLTVSEEILCQLGSVIVFQAILEKEIANEVTRLLGVDQKKGDITTSELSFRSLIAILSSLLLNQLGPDHPLYLEFKEVKKVRGVILRYKLAGENDEQ